MEDHTMNQISTFDTNGVHAKKRRRILSNNAESDFDVTADADENSLKTLMTCSCSKRFLPIYCNGDVYESEDFKPKGETLYIPLKEDLLINVQNIEQFSSNLGSFFIGDESSRFLKAVQGIALHLWRYSDTQQRLYISRSFVFTSKQAFEDVKKKLDLM